MDISISKSGEVFVLKINGVEISNVRDYKITSSAQAGTELVIKIEVQEEIMEFETLTN